MITITSDMLTQATARDHGAYNNQSFMDGAGNIAGFLGEYMVQSVCPTLTLVDCFSHDFEFLDSKGDAHKVEVKTKAQGIPTAPKGYYEASVTMNSLNHQTPDYYVFCRLYKKEYGWVMGAISTSNLLRIGRYLKKGVPDGDNGYVVKEDCINIRYNQLNNIKGEGEYDEMD